MNLGYKTCPAVFLYAFRTIIILFFAFSGSIYSQCTVTTINPGFELPVVGSSASFVHQNNVPGWSTTAPDQIIEFWINGSMGGFAHEGNQYIELNAFFASGIFQDFNSPAGTTFSFTFAHRGRVGTDSMVLKAGPPGGPYTIVTTATTGNRVWQVYSGTYVVPNNQGNTRFIFEAVSTATNDPTTGNFLDAINFTSTINTPIVTSFTPICSGNSITLTATGQNGAIISWHDANGNLLHTGTVFTSPALSIDTRYKVMQRSATGCESAFHDVDVKVNPINAPVVANFAPVCSGNSITLTATGESGAIISWYDANGNLVHTGSVFVSPVLSIDTKYRVIQTSTTGCKSGFLDVDVKVDAVNAPSVANFVPVCKGNSVTLTATAENGATVYWYDANENLVYTGPVFVSPVLSVDTKYKVMQISATGCKSGFRDVDVKVNPINTPLIANFAPVCAGNSITLTATPENGGTIYWYDAYGNLVYIGAVFVSPVLLINTKYKVMQINNAGCKSDFVDVEVMVNSGNENSSGAQLFVKQVSSPFSDGGSTIEVTVREGGTYSYEYQLDNGDFGPSNKFYGVGSGIHTIRVRSTTSGSCINLSKEILIIGYPPFFTPNGDGHNDIWNIIRFDDDDFSISNIFIFDRYGKLLKQLKPSDPGWDGTYNGVAMPSTDYWFTVNYKKEDGSNQIFRSHFSLKR